MNYSVYEVCNDAVSDTNQYLFKSFDELLFDTMNKGNTDDVIPLPVSENLEDEKEENSIDLKVLHYYMSKQILKKYPFLVKKLDETSLIMIQMLIESWVLGFIEKEDGLEDLEKDRLSYVNMHTPQSIALMSSKKSHKSHKSHKKKKKPHKKSKGLR